MRSSPLVSTLPGSAPTVVEHPCSDGKPMAGTGPPPVPLDDAVRALRRRFAEGGAVHVVGEMHVATPPPTSA